MAIIPTSKDLAALFGQGQLAGEMVNSFGLKDQAEIQEVQRRCAALHNTGTLDLLLLVEIGVLQGLNGTDFFLATDFFCRILPELETTAVRMMACVDALVTRGGDDLAANQPNAAFRTWCTRDPRRGREVIASARDGDDRACRFLTFALEAINAFAESRQIALSYDDGRRCSAITALGRMEDDDPASCAETLYTFSTLLDSGADDSLRANLLTATIAILARSKDVALTGVDVLVERLVEGAGDFTVHQAAHALWVYRKTLQPNIVASLLEALAHLNPANKGTVNELDLGLNSLLTQGHDEAVIAYVTNLLSRAEDGIELHELDSFTRTMVSGPPERLSRVVVQWLLLGKKRLCDGLADALQGRDLEGPALDLRAEDLTISSSAQIFLCRKAIGWFFMKPITAASVLVSVLRVCDNETALELQKLLLETLLLNYSCVQDYLEGLSPDDAAKVRVDQSLAEHKAYMTTLRRIPPLKELEPSEHNRRIERLRMSDQMRDAHKKVQSQSVLLNLFKHSVLLYGNRSLTFVKEGKDSFRAVEMDLNPYGVSFEMPRMEIIDPVGLDYTLRVFRTERMVS